MSKKANHVRALRRRYNHLFDRVAAAGGGSVLSYDAAERDALAWVLRELGDET